VSQADCVKGYTSVCHGFQAAGSARSLNRSFDDACRGDLELRREMLAAAPLGPIESAIGATADEPAAQPDGDPLVGTWLGPHRIDCVLGRGGMGAVYRAFREGDQFRKQVDVKACWPDPRWSPA